MSGGDFTVFSIWPKPSHITIQILTANIWFWSRKCLKHSVHILNQQGLWRNVDCYRKLFWFVTQHFATNSVDEDKLEPEAFLNKNCLKSDILFADMNCCSLTVNILISVFSRGKLVSRASFSTSFPLGKTVTKAHEKKCSSNVYT